MAVCTPARRLRNASSPAYTASMIRHTTGFTLALALVACDSGGGSEGADTYAATCERFGATYARCLAEACPNADPHQAVFAAEITQACRLVEANPTARAVYERFADGSCGDLYYGPSIEQDTTQASQAENNRKVFCESGPLVPPETCTTRCTTVTACLDDANPFSLIYGEQAPCEAACLGRPDGSATIACLASTGCAESDCTED